MDTVTVEAFDVSSYDRPQVSAMLPEGVGELGSQVLPQFINDALDAELTTRLPGQPQRAPVRQAPVGRWRAGIALPPRKDVSSAE